MNQDQKTKNEALLSTYERWTPQPADDSGREERQQMLLSGELFKRAGVPLNAQSLADQISKLRDAPQGLTEAGWAAELAKHTGRKPA